MFSKLVAPHGGRGLVCALLSGEELKAEQEKAKSLKQVEVSDRAKGDLIMMGIGGFSPLDGFMTKADWKGVCENFQMADGTFWPVPITLDVSQEEADAMNIGEEIALVRNGELMATMKVEEKYAMSDADKKWECEKVFRGEGEESQGDTFWKIAEEDHPGVIMVMNQKEVNIAGPVKVLSQSTYPSEYKGVYLTPAETRAMFEERNWKNVAALQLRNPMHRSHEFLAKIAIEVCDGVFIHQLVGKLKAGDIPADVRVKCIDALVDNYFVKNTVVQGGYPMEMRYGGPREALLHACFRQNFGCSHLIVGRDHAGVGDYYGPFDAQKIFYEIPDDALLLKPLPIDWTFFCHKCRGMASMKTCPHGKEDRVLLSGTKLRSMLSQGEQVSLDFGRQEVLDILQDYYKNLEEKVDIKLHKYSEGE